jgi:hypothetical protein
MGWLHDYRHWVETFIDTCMHIDLSCLLCQPLATRALQNQELLVLSRPFVHATFAKIAYITRFACYQLGWI